LEDELKRHKEEKEFYSNDLKKLNTYTGSSGLTLEAVRKKLCEEDESRFRQAMEDLG